MGGTKKALIKCPKKCSSAQQAHMRSLAALQSNKENNPQPESVLEERPRKTRDYKNEYSNSQRKVRHIHRKDIKLQSKISELGMQLKREKKEREMAARKFEIAAKRAADLAAECEQQLLVAQERLFGLQTIAADIRKENRALAKRVHRASGVLQRAIARTKARPFVSKLMKKGMYTVHA
ncbi:hypothetical protein K438DRAFT_1962636 [Mycena galopus ATCC 62051]|nr:hypothetical protein K438DRAFT_1962636 [Mycena galopus ATCC 62051]